MAREKLIESIADVDDVVGEKFLADDIASITEKRSTPRSARAPSRSSCVPVSAARPSRTRACSSSSTRWSTYLPSPVDIPTRIGKHPDKPEVELERKASDTAPFSALAFKIMNDKFVGNAHLHPRVLGLRSSRAPACSTPPVGRPSASAACCSRCTRTSARTSRTSSRATSPPSWALRDTRTGDTLCDEKHPVVLERMTFPEPVISIAIEPKTKADQDKMGVGLQKLAFEDPSFRVNTDEESGQTIIHGMGELHLEIIVDRLKREYKVEANTASPRSPTARP
jgi:elongation factor G